jgi:ABC-type glycerol-3-phosphate transport system permease component
MNSLSNRKAWSQKILWAVLLSLLFLVVAPLLWLILGVFKTNAEIFGSPFALPESWKLDNIISAWQLGNFQTYIGNSTIITVGGMLLVFLVACPAGYALAQLKFRGNQWLFYFFLLGLAVPVQSIIIPIFYQLKALGLINELLGIILVSVAIAIPFSVFLMRNSFKDIPSEMREAAIMDGASEWRCFITIMLPMAKPGIVTLMVFTFMSIWNDFMLPLVLLIDNSKYTLALGLYSFNQENVTNYGLIFGGTLISMIPSLIVYFIFQRHFTSGMTAGSGK